MANATVAQAVNRQTVALALRDARAKCAASHRWLNAVNRAALNLESCRWSFDGDTLRVESATNSGDFYTVTVETCPCSAGKAGKPCWHRAGVRLLCKAAEMGQEAPSIGVTYKGVYYSAASLDASEQARASRPTMEELQAAADELFA
jgi:hypothetical protein